MLDPYADAGRNAEYQARKDRLMARHGKTEFTDAAPALELVGADGGVSPDHVYACLYASREAAEAYAASNLKHHGYPSLGIVKTESGWLGVTDLRSALAALVRNTG